MSVDTDKPLACAMPRELQCVASGGTLSGVVVISASMRVLHCTRRTRTRRVAQTVDPVLGEASPPLPDRVRADLQLGRYLLVLRFLGTGQHDPGTQRYRLRGRAPGRQPLQLRPFGLRQHQLNRTTPWHGQPIPTGYRQNLTERVESAPGPNATNFRLRTLAIVVQYAFLIATKVKRRIFKSSQSDQFST